MIRLENGAVNEEHVAAILKRGSNWELVLASGQALTISEADARAAMNSIGVDAPAKAKP
jgi:hypothetical protein